MKLSDYVIDYLVRAGSSHTFGMSGGAAVHLFDSASKNERMGTTFVTHEQSAAIAADGFSRLSGYLGTSIVTSGPGATNLLTGVCCSFYDSVPTLMLTGQVATHRLKGDRKVRQVGFQETDVLSIYGSVTKFAAQILDPLRIGAVLDEAYHVARSDRPGPVLVDIPDDLQRADIDPGKLASFRPAPATQIADITGDVRGILDLVAKAQRPAMIIGGGFSTPRHADELRSFLERLRIPVLQTWAGTDLVPFEWAGRVGPFGVYGPRLGNVVVQKSDLLLCLGTRLSQNLTGGLLNTFAKDASIVMVDVDQGEMDKFDGRGIDVAVRLCSRMDDFLRTATACLEDYKPPEMREWRASIESWKTGLPTDIPSRPADNANHVDAVHFVQEISEHFAADEAIFIDTGGNLTWTCNHLKVKKDQRVLSAWNFTPMGYALPAAIGGASVDSSRPISCIIGDGGLTLCLGELATVLRYNLPIKIFLFNNHCHGIQKQTLETWLGSNYVGVDPASGLGFPDFEKVAAAMGFPIVSIRQSSEIKRRLREVFGIRGPVFCNVEINPDQKLFPVLKYGHSLEDQMPLLEREKLDQILSM